MHEYMSKIIPARDYVILSKLLATTSF